MGYLVSSSQQRRAAQRQCSNQEKSEYQALQDRSNRHRPCRQAYDCMKFCSPGLGEAMMDCFLAASASWCACSRRCRTCCRFSSRIFCSVQRRPRAKGVSQHAQSTQVCNRSSLLKRHSWPGKAAHAQWLPVPTVQLDSTGLGHPSLRHAGAPTKIQAFTSSSSAARCSAAARCCSSSPTTPCRQEQRHCWLGWLQAGQRYQNSGNTAVCSLTARPQPSPCNPDVPGGRG